LKTYKAEQNISKSLKNIFVVKQKLPIGITMHKIDR